jgi:hypothetical protein
MILPKETNYEFLMEFIMLKNSSKTDKTAVNPAKLDTACIRSSTLLEILF